MFITSQVVPVPLRVLGLLPTTADAMAVLTVAVILLGPDKLPKMAKQIGSLWGDFRKFRERLESDVRGNFPDLPSTESITQAVRPRWRSCTTSMPFAPARKKLGYAE